MNCSKVIGPERRKVSSRKVLSGVWFKGIGYRLPGQLFHCHPSPVGFLIAHLRVAFEHFHDDFMQVIVEKLLERPGKLRILDLALGEHEFVAVFDAQAGAEIDSEANGGAARDRRKAKERMLIACQLCLYFLQQQIHILA